MANKIDSFNAISTTTEGWQLKCWDWAKSKEPFQVEGTIFRHRLFLEELSSTYGYKLQHRDEGVVFVPISAG